MREKLKGWYTGGLSAVLAYCSTLPSGGGPAVCAGVSCGACPVGCFSGIGAIWLIILYLRKTGGLAVLRRPACWQSAREQAAVEINYRLKTGACPVNLAKRG